MAQCQGPRAQMVRLFFGLHLFLAERCCENPQSTRGPAQCKPGPRITWLLGIIIYCTSFQKQFTSNSPVFTPKDTFEKKLGKMFIEQITELELRGPGSPGRTCTPIPG